jgi:hypothetical protein
MTTSPPVALLPTPHEALPAGLARTTSTLPTTPPADYGTCMPNFRALGGSVLLLSMLLLPGCTGDGPSVQRAYFSTNNAYDGCSSIRVSLYLDSSEAVLDRNDDGTINCQIDPARAGDGCRLLVSEQVDEARVDIDIVGCDIDVVSDLFHCDFRQLDASSRDLGVAANCLCTPTSCHFFGQCSLCVSDDASRSTCERCDNDVDDDGDGDMDCWDDDCAFLEECFGCGTTRCYGTSSTTTTTDTTTSTSPTTTTTLEVSDRFYSIVYRLDTASAVVGSLQFESAYSSAPGVFRGSDGSVYCTNDVSGALFAPNDADDEEKLSLGWIALAGFSAPTNLATCTFQPDSPEAPEPGDFGVSNVAATDTEFNDVAVSISAMVIPVP